MIDIRFPIGLMFSVFGIIITVYGLATMSNDALYLRSLNINVNLISGICMLIFGLIMLFFSTPFKNWIKKRRA